MTAYVVYRYTNIFREWAYSYSRSEFSNVNQTNAAILGILAAGVLGGCVSGPLATEWKDATVKRFRAPATDSLRLYVYRASAGGFSGGALLDIEFDGDRKTAVSLGEKSFAVVELEPGPHTVVVYLGDQAKAHAVRTTAGESFY